MAGFLTWRPNNQFEFNLSLEHYGNKTTSPEGSGASGGAIPVVANTNRPANLPRWFTSSDPIMWRNYPYKVDRTLIGFNWTYNLNESWKLTQRFHYVTIDETKTALGNWGAVGADGLITVRSFINNPVQRSIYGTNLDLVGNFDTGPFQHKVLVGLDWFQYTETFKGFIGPVPELPALSIYQPIYGNLNSGLLSFLVNRSSANTIWKWKTGDFGLYAQDQITIANRLILVLGGRYDLASTVHATLYADRFAPCFPNCTGEPQQTLTEWLSRREPLCCTRSPTMSPCMAVIPNPLGPPMA